MRLNCWDVWESDQCDISVFGIPILFMFFGLFIFFTLSFAFLSFLFLFLPHSASHLTVSVSLLTTNPPGHLSCTVCAEDSHLKTHFSPPSSPTSISLSSSIFSLFLIFSHALFSPFCIFPSHLFLSFIFCFFFLSCLLHLLVLFSPRWERATPATPTRTWWFNW